MMIEGFGARRFINGRGETRSARREGDRRMQSMAEVRARLSACVCAVSAHRCCCRCGRCWRALKFCERTVLVCQRKCVCEICALALAGRANQRTLLLSAERESARTMIEAWLVLSAPRPPIAGIGVMRNPYKGFQELALSAVDSEPER